MFAAIDNIPGMCRTEIWAQVAQQLEQEPDGACYRGYRITAFAVEGPGERLHEVDDNRDWRFDTLEAALMFIDVLEA